MLKESLLAEIKRLQIHRDQVVSEQVGELQDGPERQLIDSELNKAIEAGFKGDNLSVSLALKSIKEFNNAQIGD